MRTLYYNGIKEYYFAICTNYKCNIIYQTCLRRLIVSLLSWVDHRLSPSSSSSVSKKSKRRLVPSNLIIGSFWLGRRHRQRRHRRRRRRCWITFLHFPLIQSLLIATFPSFINTSPSNNLLEDSGHWKKVQSLLSLWSDGFLSWLMFETFHLATC